MSDVELLGSSLREARERLKLSLSEAERITKIRARYLEALEQGNYASLPSVVHARGFLRNYARAIGLDGDLTVAQFDELISGNRRRNRKDPAPLLPNGEAPMPIKRAARITQETPSVRLSRTGSFEAITPQPFTRASAEKPANGPQLATRIVLILAGLILISALAVIGLTAAGVLQLPIAGLNAPSAILTPLATATAPSVAAPTFTPTLNLPSPLPVFASTGTPTDLPTPTAVPNQVIPTTPAGQGTAATGTVKVEFQIVARTWINVVVDGQPVYTGSADPGSQIRYEGREIRVRVSNAVGVLVLVNDISQGIMGARGEIVEQTYTASGIRLPTATATATVLAGASELGLPPTAPPTASGPSALRLPTGTRLPATQQTPESPPEQLVRTTESTLTASPTATFFVFPTQTSLPSNTPLPTASPSATATGTYTPSMTFTPSRTKPPTQTFTPTATFTPSATVLFLPRETSTPLGGEIRTK